MSSTWVTVLSAGGGVFGALFTYLGVRLTQRQAAKAQQVTAEIERSKIDAAAYGEARRIWDTLIKELQAKVDAQRAEINDLRRRLDDLEQKRAGDRHAIHVLTDYARQLLKVIKDNDLVPPPPPHGLDLEG